MSRWTILLAVGVIFFCAAASTAAERHRTPAEIELRRAEIASRLADLAEEAQRIERTLKFLEQAIAAGSADERSAVAGRRAEIEARLAGLVAERDGLTAESQELAGIATRTATGPLVRADAPGLRPAQVAAEAGQVSAGTAFNPAITVIPDGLYYYDNSGGHGTERFRAAGGLGTGRGDAEAGHVPRGFSLREVELAFSGAVDPYFDVWAVFGIGEGGIEAEEVYVQTRRFLPGAQMRFGRFFSGIGYLNRQHRHQWDFVDQALTYDLLFGQKLADVGVQVTWLPALPIYTQFGFEALQGDNPSIAQQLVDQYPDLLDDVPGPRLFTGFLKVSPDLGFSHTLQGGMSVGRSRSHQEAGPSAALTEVLNGSAWFVGTDWIWRFDSARPYGDGDVTLQAEYFYRAKTLELLGAVAPGESGARDDGLYAQLVYGIGPRWTVGGRFDVVGLHNRLETLAGTVDPGASTRFAVNATFNPTEFSRLRVQYNHGRVPDDASGRIHQFYVQFQMSLGVHGAHVF
jgi:hypothetical protein